MGKIKLKKIGVITLSIILVLNLTCLTILIKPGTAKAASANITQIVFTSASRTIEPGQVSAVLTTQTQNVDGASEQVSEKTTLVLTTNSSTGSFSSSASSFSPVTQLTMSTDTANKNFYYKDSTPGTYNLEVTAQGHTWESARQQITINPYPEATLSGVPSGLTNQISVMITVGGANVISYKSKLDAAPYDVETPIATPIYLSALSDSPHTLEVIGKNSAGTWQQESSPTTASWTVDTTPPSDASISLIDQDSNSTEYTNSQTVNASIADDIDATVWLLSEAQSTQPSASDSAWQISEPTTFDLSAGDGLKTVYIWTKDAAENVSNLGNSAQITLDTQAPIIQITRDPDKDLTNTDYTLTVDFGDPTQIRQYNLDETGWTDYASAVIVSTEGLHTFEAQGTDAAGNSGLASVSFTIDKTAPAIPSSPSASVTDGKVTLSWEMVSDADHYEIWRSSSPYVLIAVVPGSQNNYTDTGVERGKTYQYSIVAVDEAGNGSIGAFISILVPALSPTVVSPILPVAAQAEEPKSALGTSTFPSSSPSISPSSSPSGTVEGEKNEGQGTETKGTNYKFLYWLIPILVILLISFLLWWRRRQDEDDDEYDESEEI